jgi:DNA-binding MarR family transcriptional regulator
VEQGQAEIFKSYGLTLPQFNILRILRGQHPKPATVNLLIERMLDKTSNASRIVDKLVAKGLVSRTQCEYDRRTVDVLITPTGLDLLAQIDRENKSMHSGINNLTDAEAKTLNQLLDKIRS